MKAIKFIIGTIFEFFVMVINFILGLFFSRETPKDYLEAIGKPKKFDKIEIAQFDIPMNMTWEEADAVCASLGEGWRLPTLEELRNMYKHRERIGDFITEVEKEEEEKWVYYWTSENYPADPDGQAYYVRFDNGHCEVTSKFSDNLSFRPVRDIEFRKLEKSIKSK